MISRMFNQFYASIFANIFEYSNFVKFERLKRIIVPIFVRQVRVLRKVGGKNQKKVPIICSQFVFFSLQMPLIGK